MKNNTSIQLTESKIAANVWFDTIQKDLRFDARICNIYLIQDKLYWICVHI